MDIQLLTPSELTESHRDLWKQMMQTEQISDGPFFHPDYTTILGEHRKQIRVAVVSEQNRPIAFFPFEKHGKCGKPLGIKLCDFQGIVRATGAHIDAAELLRGCDLKKWQFDHLVSSQPEFQSWEMRQDDSLYIDLTNGYEAYLEERKRAGTSQITVYNRKSRKLERDLGPVTFQWHTNRREVFETILELKSAQRKRTGTFDILQFEWVKEFLNQIRTTHCDRFEGVLSTLQVNDQLIAAHLGMKTDTVFHYWFPVYDPKFQKYSPGLILLLKTAEAAAKKGIQRIDLGKGGERYKRSLGSGSIPVGEGVVDERAIHHIARSMWFRTREWIRATPLRKTLQYPKRLIRSFQTSNAMN